MSNNTEAPIAILGGTSKLAQDYVLRRSERSQQPMYLYARSPDMVEEFLLRHGLPRRHRALCISSFGDNAHSAVVNFIGVGDPARAKALGADILEITLAIDTMVLNYLRRYPEAKYVFLSSGAAYGGEFGVPATDDTLAVFPINSLQPQDHYGAAKFHAEVRHRGHADSTIVDVRIFNYVSRAMDLGGKFLLTDMVNAVRTGAVFKTSDAQLTRDFLSPEDLTNLLDAALRAPDGANFPVDAYTAAPISKAEMIGLMERAFGMRSEVVPGLETVNATGRKASYYSLNRSAATLGYAPQHTSASGILTELGAILN